MFPNWKNYLPPLLFWPKWWNDDFSFFGMKLFAPPQMTRLKKSDILVFPPSALNLIAFEVEEGGWEGVSTFLTAGKSGGSITNRHDDDGGVFPNRPRFNWFTCFPASYCTNPQWIRGGKTLPVWLLFSFLQQQERKVARGQERKICPTQQHIVRRKKRVVAGKTGTLHSF